MWHPCDHRAYFIFIDIAVAYIAQLSNQVISEMGILTFEMEIWKERILELNYFNEIWRLFQKFHLLFCLKELSIILDCKEAILEHISRICGHSMHIITLNDIKTRTRNWDKKTERTKNEKSGFINLKVRKKVIGNFEYLYNDQRYMK